MNIIEWFNIMIIDAEWGFNYGKSFCLFNSNTIIICQAKHKEVGSTKQRPFFKLKWGILSWKSAVNWLWDYINELCKHAMIMRYPN